MPTLVMVLALILVTIVSVWIGEITRLPYPVLLLLFVAGLSFVPEVPVFTMNPEVILPLFLPPLLFAVARRASLTGPMRLLTWLTARRTSLASWPTFCRDWLWRSSAKRRSKRGRPSL